MNTSRPTADELSRKKFGDRLNRRTAIKGAAALGLVTPGISRLVAHTAAAPVSHSPFLSRNQSTTLSFFHDKDTWQDYFIEMSDLATEQIDIGFEPTPYSDTTSYQQVVNSSIQSGDTPDLVTWWSGYRLENLYQSGGLLDVSDLWQKAIDSGDMPESLAASFTFEDKQWGVARDASYWPVFYNKRLFDEHGLSVPTTWDEFLDVCETLKDASVTPLYATIDGRWPAFIWFEEFLIRNDPDFYVDLCEGRASYTDDTAVKAMQDWKSLFDAGYFSDLDIPMDANAAGMFANGEIAMMPVGTWFQQQFLAVDMVPGEDFDAFLLPNVNPDLDQNVMIIETGAIAIPADGDNLEQSKELAAWWDQLDAQTLWSSRLGDTPANPKVESDNLVLNNLITTVSEGEYQLLQRYWEASPPAIVENAVDELARFMLNPDESQQVLETIQSIAEEEWARREEESR